MTKYKYIFILMAILIMLSINSYGNVPEQMNYQGMLTDKQGNIVSDGDYEIIFKIYSTSTGGSPLWEEKRNVKVGNGLFNILLGTINPITPNIFNENTRFLTLEINGKELLPRQKVVTVGYAFTAAKSKDADALNGKQAADFASFSHTHDKDTITTNILSSLDGVTNDGGDIDLVAGKNITITPDDVNDKITISAAETVDNLGNHTATQNIKLNGNYLSGDGGDEGVYVDNVGKVGIGTKNPEFKLDIFDDGGLIAKGNVDKGVNLITKGKGAKMIWYPKKAAFRVGYTTNNQWDDENIGIFSTAMGSSTTASGLFSTAMGNNSKASGFNSTAMGNNTTASNFYCTAMGNNTTASGNCSTAMGNNTTASGDNSTTMGYKTSASKNYSTAMGNNTTASGDNSTAMGHNTLASGGSSIAMGNETKASGYASIAIGNKTSASGDNATAMGSSTSANGYFSTAMGSSTTAESAYEISIGRYNTDYTPKSNTEWESSDRLFVIGNGTILSRSDAMVILKNGNVGIGISEPKAKLHVNAIMRLQPQETPPSGGLGDLYVGTNGKLYFHNGSAWKEVALAP